MMEFEEMQKIWDSQNNKPLYAINEEALHNRIQSKKKQARHLTNFSELMLIIVNLGAGCFVLGINLFQPGGNIYMCLLGVWMLTTSLYVLGNRIRRINGDKKFDRSVRGDLDHAISLATYQVRLSQIMRWNILPIGAFALLGLWDSGKALWIAGLVLIFFVFAYYAGAREHSIYIARKHQLEILQNKLEGEESGK